MSIPNVANETPNATIKHPKKSIAAIVIDIVVEDRE